MNDNKNIRMSVDDITAFLTSSKLAAAGGDEWVVIHSYLVDEENGRASVSPPMLALKWSMAEVIFNSLLDEGMRNTAQRLKDAYLAILDNTDEVFRLGIFPERTTEVYPVEMLMAMKRTALTDELYHEFYLREGPGEPAVYEVPLNPDQHTKSRQLH